MIINDIDAMQCELDGKMEDVADSLSDEAVYDGIICPERYVKSKYKVLWLAREPHDDGGDYDYKSDIMNKIKAGELVGNKYFNKMRDLQYSLNNGYLDWDGLKNIDRKDYNYNNIGDIAFINCSKIPGGANLDWGKWWSNCEAFKDIVAKQIEIANPDIIICVGTRNYLEKYGYLNDAIMRAKSYRNYYLKEGRLILDCYHISARYSNRLYFNDIISSIKEWKNLTIAST